jgi:hypothetical protein
MNHTIGLFGALLAGGAAALLHLAALDKARSEARVPTIGYAAVKKDYAAGEPLDFTMEKAPEFFYQINIPEKAKVPAVRISDLESVIGMRVPRPMKAGELLLIQDVAPANPSLLLREAERALLVSLKDVAAEPKLLRVGAEVGFVVEAAAGKDAGGSADQSSKPAPQDRLREVGPFRIVSVGDQVADGVRGTSQTIGVAIKIDDNGQLTESGAMLLDASEKRRLRALTLFGG